MTNPDLSAPAPRMACSHGLVDLDSLAHDLLRCLRTALHCRHEVQPAVTMHRVAPGRKRQHPCPCLVQRAEALHRIVRPVLAGPEHTLGIRVVVRYLRSAVRGLHTQPLRRRQQRRGFIGEPLSACSTNGWPWRAMPSRRAVRCTRAARCSASHSPPDAKLIKLLSTAHTFWRLLGAAAEDATMKTISGVTKIH